MRMRTPGGVTRGGLAATSAVLALSLVVWAAAALAAPATLDTSFSGDGKLTTSFDTSNDVGQDIAIQPDGKIVVAGTVGNEGTSSCCDVFGVARYNADGSPDAGFGGGDGRVSTAMLDPDLNEIGGIAASVALDNSVSPPRIVVAGTTVDAVNFVSGEDIAVVRYTSTGVLDSSFNGDGRAFQSFAPDPAPDPDFTRDHDSAGAVAVDAAGKVVVGGYGDPSDAGAIQDAGALRFNVNGTLDDTFAGDGRATMNVDGSNDFVEDVKVYANGSVLLAGHNQGAGETRDITLARLSSGGVLDPGFGGDGIRDFHFGVADAYYGVTLQPDGKILGAGESRTTGGSSVFFLVRHNTNGDLDTSFAGDSTATGSFGAENSHLWNDVAVQADGKIVTAGIVGFPSDADFAVGRFHANGQVDKTFGKCTGAVDTDFGGLANDYAQGLALQSNGRIVVAGSTFNDFAVARYLGGTASDPDCTPPKTTITGPARTRSRRPSFRLHSNEAGSRFQCRVGGVGEKFQACTSPYKVRKIRRGSRSIEARAIDKAGNIDASPAVKRFRILKPKKH